MMQESQLYFKKKMRTPSVKALRLGGKIHDDDKGMHEGGEQEGHRHPQSVETQNSSRAVEWGVSSPAPQGNSRERQLLCAQEGGERQLLQTWWAQKVLLQKQPHFYSSALPLV